MQRWPGFSIVYKLILTGIFVLAGQAMLCAQVNQTDSLEIVVNNYRNQPGYQADTNYINTLNELAFTYQYNKPDTTLLLADEVIRLCNKLDYTTGKTEAIKNKGLAYMVKGEYNLALDFFNVALTLSRKINYPAGEGKILQNLGIVYSNLGNYPESLENYFQALKLREKLGDKFGICSSLTGIGAVYFMQGKYNDALANYIRGLNIAREIDSKSSIQNSYANIGEVYFKLGNYTAAEENLGRSLELDPYTGNKGVKAFISVMMGSIYIEQQNYSEAIQAFTRTQILAAELGSPEYASRSALGMGKVNLATNKLDEAMQQIQQGIAIANQIRFPELQRDGHELLSRAFEAKGMGMDALHHHKLFKLYADSINNQLTEKIATNLAAEYAYSKKEIALKAEQEKRELEFRRRTAQQRWVIFSALAALLSALVVVWQIYRSRQKEKMANVLLQSQNEEIARQKADIEHAMKELNATQAQLIHSEKMASLGELTAGIAHEIQNPLNFVNNFSEVNSELISELVEEVEKGNINDVKLIAADIKDNSEKINNHGKRAAAIVKGMLQHSRSSSGVKEPADINALADEYLRLAYHGLRAKDKTFNARILTDYDNTIGTVQVITQDIGRVILNLITNAFYVVTEKKKQNVVSYEPTVTVSTKNDGEKIKISVSDNGAGIPQKVLDKIFQPFFTTKPTGQGTGLGLSLSYDIVNAHGGKLQVTTEEGEGSTFTIVLPKG